MIAIQIGEWWNLGIVLICIFFMTRVGEHFFMQFLVIWTSAYEKALFSSFVYFIIGSLIFWEFSF
jgi:hypothetical protein